MVDDLPDRCGRQMQPEQRTGPGGRKTLVAGTAVQQIAVFVLFLCVTGSYDCGRTLIIKFYHSPGNGLSQIGAAGLGPV